MPEPSDHVESALNVGKKEEFLLSNSLTVCSGQTDFQFVLPCLKEHTTALFSLSNEYTPKATTLIPGLLLYHVQMSP